VGGGAVTNIANEHWKRQKICKRTWLVEKISKKFRVQIPQVGKSLRKKSRKIFGKKIQIAFAGGGWSSKYRCCDVVVTFSSDHMNKGMDEVS